MVMNDKVFEVLGTVKLWKEIVDKPGTNLTALKWRTLKQMHSFQTKREFYKTDLSSKRELLINHY